MAKKIFGMGNPLLDISADVDAAYLEKYGLKPANAILAEDSHQPMYAELSKMEGVKFIPGGSTLNSIRVAQWMLSRNHQGSTFYNGCIGKDEYGATLRKNATADGVQMVVMEDAETATGTCAVCITGKERSMVANLAAANKFVFGHMADQEVQKAVHAAEIFYSAGFFLTVCPPALNAVAFNAAQTGKIFALNLSAPFICQFFGGPLGDALPYVDILFGNEDEAAAFAEARGFADKSVEGAAKAAANLPKASARPRLVVFTQGSECTITCSTGDGETQKHAVPAIPKAQIVDTNGAGDAFVGGFLSQFALGKHLADCVKAGHFAAGKIIQISGTTLPAEPPAEY